MHSCLRLFCESCKMRRYDRVLTMEDRIIENSRFLAEYVDSGCCDHIVVQRICQVLLIYDRTAARVDEDRSFS